MKKRLIKVLGIAITASIILTGCSSTNELDNNKEVKETAKVEQFTQETIDSDKYLLMNRLEIINGFIAENSTKLSLYLGSGDSTSAIAYAKGLSDSEYREEIDESMNTLKSEVENPQAKKMAEKISSLYFDFMDISDMIADGKINEEMNTKVNNLTQKITDVTNETMEIK